MRMYLKNNDEFKKNVGSTAYSNHAILDETVRDAEVGPWIELTDDFDILKQNELLPKVFLKATIVTFPSYYTYREYGLYYYGHAKAELAFGDNKHYCLKIETSSWKGISDMKTLQEKIQAGTVMPTISYAGKQVKNHLLEILAQILDSRNLNKIQRFFLAWRLSNKK